jgi:U3 small nucleolar RNA-associated protein 12
VSGSADKSVKIWGLDFGDCHRSLRAHDDSVMRVQFVKVLRPASPRPLPPLDRRR